MPTLLADSPAAPAGEQQPPPESPGAPPGPDLSVPPARKCANCGASMDTAQEWCLQCGAGAPGSLVTRTPLWRSTATVLAATAILAVGAAAAAYAALSKTGTTAHRATVVAQAPAPVPVTPVTPTATPKAALPPATTTAKTPALKPALRKLPKIPLTPVVPKSTTTTPAPSTTTPAKATPNTPASKPKATPITLDTNAVTSYNPNGYPAATLGDPSLAIDGETSTGWTAQVDPAIAPKMAVGLVVDLKSARRLSELSLITSTPGMGIQIFGSNAGAVPTTITDPAWVQLSGYLVEKKRHVLVPLRHSTTAFRFVTLWISGAPAAAIGTPQSPGRVSVNELELFPAK